MISLTEVDKIQDDLGEGEYEGCTYDLCMTLLDHLRDAISEIEKLKEADDGKKDG